MSRASPLRIGMVGAGTISGRYLETVGRLEDLRLTAVADLDAARAEAAPRASWGCMCSR